jgi:acetolactate synthase-1/2/3 large subunit
MQLGAENAYGGIAQAWSELVPTLVMPMGYSRRLAWIDRNYNAALSMRSITKSAEAIMFASEIPSILSRAFMRLKSGGGGPVLVEVPNDLWNKEVDVSDYVRPQRMRTGSDPESVRGSH